MAVDLPGTVKPGELFLLAPSLQCHLSKYDNVHRVGDIFTTCEFFWLKSNAPRFMTLTVGQYTGILFCYLENLKKIDIHIDFMIPHVDEFSCHTRQ